MSNLIIWLVGCYLHQHTVNFGELTYTEQYEAAKTIAEKFVKSKQRKDFVNDSLAVEGYILYNKEELEELLTVEIWT